MIDGARAHRVDAAGDWLHLGLVERAEQRGQQQRVAGTRLVAGRAERGLGGRAEHPTGQRRRGGRAQGLGPDRRGRRDGAKRIGQRIHRLLPDPADRHRDQDRQILEPAQEVGQRAQRWRIRPLRVVERDDKRGALGEVGREPVQGVQAGQEAAAGRGRRDVVTGDVEHGGRRCGGTREQPPTGLGARRDERRLEQTPRHPEREVAFEWAAACGEHLQPALPRPGSRHPEQGRLPDTRRPLNEQQPTGTAGDGRHQPVDHGELGAPLQEAALVPTAHVSTPP